MAFEKYVITDQGSVHPEYKLNCNGNRLRNELDRNRASSVRVNFPRCPSFRVFGYEYSYSRTRIPTIGSARWIRRLVPVKTPTQTVHWPLVSTPTPACSFRVFAILRLGRHPLPLISQCVTCALKSHSAFPPPFTTNHDVLSLLAYLMRNRLIGLHSELPSMALRASCDFNNQLFALAPTDQQKQCRCEKYGFLSPQPLLPVLLLTIQHV